MNGRTAFVGIGEDWWLLRRSVIDPPAARGKAGPESCRYVHTGRKLTGNP